MKKFIAVLMALILSLSVFSLAVFADDETADTEVNVELRIMGGDELTVNYRDHAVVEAAAYGLTDNQKLEIDLYNSDDDIVDEVTEQNGYYGISIMTGELTGKTYTAIVTVYDESSDEIVAQESQTITVRTNFFAKLFAFFRIDLIGRSDYKEADISNDDVTFANKCNDYYVESHSGKALNWTVEEIADYYNAARENTPENIDSHQDMALVGDITADGAAGAILKILTPAAEKALANNSKDLSGVPAQGHSDIKASDIESASARMDDNGNIVLCIQLKNQTDGSDADDKNGGPVARGIGTLGSIDSALSELGAEITEGKDTVRLAYTDAYLRNIVINSETNEIITGIYHYTVNVTVGYAKAKLGVTATLENLQATIDYTVTVG